MHFKRYKCVQRAGTMSDRGAYSDDDKRTSRCCLPSNITFHLLRHHPHHLSSLYSQGF